VPTLKTDTSVYEALREVSRSDLLRDPAKLACRAEQLAEDERPPTDGRLRGIDRGSIR